MMHMYLAGLEQQPPTDADLVLSDTSASSHSHGLSQSLPAVGMHAGLLTPRKKVAGGLTALSAQLHAGRDVKMEPAAKKKSPKSKAQSQNSAAVDEVLMTGSHKGTLSSSAPKRTGRAGKDELKRKWGPGRKVSGFWSTFNGWWRQEYERVGRRPTSEEVSSWYSANANNVWAAAEKPSVQETRRHAKCLRTTEEVRNYFRKYRAQRSKGSKPDKTLFRSSSLNIPKAKADKGERATRMKMQRKGSAESSTLNLGQETQLLLDPEGYQSYQSAAGAANFATSDPLYEDRPLESSLDMPAFPNSATHAQVVMMSQVAMGAAMGTSLGARAPAPLPRATCSVPDLTKMSGFMSTPGMYSGPMPIQRQLAQLQAAAEGFGSSKNMTEMAEDYGVEESMGDLGMGNVYPHGGMAQMGEHLGAELPLMPFVDPIDDPIFDSNLGEALSNSASVDFTIL